ncbi:glycosyl hydrolase family 47-domain-containing protein [Lophiotrema nucula]|uniref:alpha-1,2-Mannosidase n=1 Tax=Lophiotrema nucula TaxID=690887 RepID=A0A6A5ZRY5_9PLEO|nr:glycosyl hydrolase family 47-domain-containing protein [Lophiotrema nucula]
MLRLRRYRVFLVFAVITVIALYKFSGSTSAAWTYESADSTVNAGADSKPEKEAVSLESLHWGPRPQVAQETKKFEVAIPAASSLAKETPPAIPPVTKPVDKVPTTSAEVAKTPTRPTPVGAGGPENDSPPDPDNEVVAGGKGKVEVTPLPSSVTPIHWSKLSEHFPVPSKSIIPLPSGSPKKIPKIQFEFKKETTPEKADRESKLNKIKEVFKHNWEGYRNNAWLQDELSPVSGNFRNPFASWGATLVDALDTLWIMGLEKEFEEAAKAVDEIDFTTSPRSDIPLFETTIRYLGGLVAAYDISGKKYKNLLDKAVELAELLISAFDTPNRMPQTYYYWRPAFASQAHRASNRVVLAEIGSLSVEFTSLAQLTGEHKYYDAIARITDYLEEFQNKTRLPGMWPTYLDASGCKRIDWASQAETPSQAPLDGLAATPEESLQEKSEPGLSPGGNKYIPLQKPDPIEFAAEKNTSPAANPTESIKEDKPATEQTASTGEKLSPGGNKYISLAKPDPIEFVPETAAPKPTGAPKNLKRQLDDTEESKVEREATSVVNSAASPTATHPECEEQGFVSSSEYGGEDYTLGGMSDSTYEYLPKEYLLLGGLVEKYRTMYETSMDVVKKNLIFRPMLPKMEDILFSGALSVLATKPANGKPALFEGENAHLTCFAGGMFAMGAKIFDRPDDLEIAKKLTEGCVWSYNMTSTGIMPEAFVVTPCESTKNCEWNQTLYWETLDPNSEARMVSHRQQMDSYKEQMASASAWYEAEMAAFTAAPTATSSLESLAIPTERVVADTLDKRQIDVDKPHIPSQVGVYAHQAESEPEEAEGPPTKVQPIEESIIPVTPTKPVFPQIYSPRPMLTHEEYVKNRIQEERLPPGVTHIKANNYILRPEAIESVWYMYRITGDNHWREAGWQMFLAIQEHTATKFGNSAIDDVTKTSPELLDEMESFWLAETLKYFYLLFADEDVVNLDEWVLNTEAHPFRRPT